MKKRGMSLKKTFPFDQKIKNGITRILVDEKGIIKSLNQTGLKIKFIEILQETWGNKDINWDDYEYELGSLMQKKDIKQIYKESITFEL